MPKHIRMVGHFCLAFFFFQISVIAAEQTDYPITVVDGVGREVTLTKIPERISSKTLFTDELLLAMLPVERLTSLTNLANDPSYSNLVDKVPAKLPLLALNVEAIINNRPDLVFAANWSDIGAITQLEQSGIAVYLVNTPFSIAAIQQEITQLGFLLNAAHSSQNIIEQMNTQLAAIEEKRSAIANKQLVALDYNTWGTANGKNTTWQAVLDGVGLINGSAKYEQNSFGQVPMSKELIVAINPDVLFLPGWAATGDDNARDFFEQVANDPALAGVTAVREGRVYAIPEPLRGTYSQYIVDTIEFVINLISQDLS